MTQEMDQLVIAVSAALLKRRWKLVTAESCTGGGIAYHLTNLAGSSDWFERGFVTYSNLSKHELLNVPLTTLDQLGAVSEQAAREMAEGALEHSDAQVSVAVTGIAGPSGGSKEKPVGTVWFAWAGIHTETETFLATFLGDRYKVREQTIEVALKKLLGILEKSQ